MRIRPRGHDKSRDGYRHVRQFVAHLHAVLRHVRPTQNQRPLRQAASGDSSRVLGRRVSTGGVQSAPSPSDAPPRSPRARPRCHRPKLPTCYWWSAVPSAPEWDTNLDVLLDRTSRHITRHYRKAPPSCNAPKVDNEPKDWRCESWEQVRKRCHSIDILREAERANTAEGSSGVAQPCTQPRTLEVYCGRAGWSGTHRTPLGCMLAAQCRLAERALDARSAPAKTRRFGLLPRLGSRLCQKII